jgi:serine/threonine-protein kinase
MQMVDAQQRRFVFRETLGQGGFGEVYLAEMQAPSGLTSTVAVKVLHGGLDPASQAVRRLTDEGRILSMLNHPGIVAVHDLAIIEGRVALVTEFVEGADLPDCITGDDPIPKGALYEAFAAVADALLAAHEATDSTGKPLGLLHRDVKPRNVRIGRHGQVKLLDFGIATGSGVAREAQTGTNALIGSFPYMAPERFKRTEGLGPASDVYSLGCALYEMLANGERLFFQEDVAELIVPKTVPDSNTAFLDERLGLLEDHAPEAIPLLRAMVHLDADQRPETAALVSRLEDLAAEAGGTRLARWARAHDWTATAGSPGSLSGRSIVESASISASEPSPPVSPPSTAAPTFDDESATTRTALRTGLGAAALLTTGGGLFLVVLLLTVAVGVLWLQQGRPPDTTGLEVPDAVPVAVPPPGPGDPVAPEPTEPTVPGRPDPVVGDPAPSDVDSTTTPPPDPAASPDQMPDARPAPATGADVQACGALADLEIAASSGRLRAADRSCLAQQARNPALSQTDRGKLGRITLVDAQARCKAGQGCADYEREQPWYFEDIDQSDADMMLAWALYQKKQGRSADARVWARKSLANKHQWVGRTRIDRLDTLYRLDALAAADLWGADPRNEARRNEAKEAAANWAEFRSEVRLPTDAAMDLCIAAAGSAGPCNARVPDRAAKRSIVFASVPAGATLTVDGAARGVTPRPVELSFGAHTVVLTLDGKTTTHTLEVGMESAERYVWTAAEDRWEDVH